MAETQPGGLYIVGGKTVDANGKATEAVEVETVEEDFEDDQPKPKTLDDGTVPQLKALAEREEIDLGAATKKADIIAAIVKGRKAKAALFSLEPAGDDGGEGAPEGDGKPSTDGAPDGNATPPAGPPAPDAPPAGAPS